MLVTPFFGVSSWGEDPEAPSAAMAVTPAPRPLTAVRVTWWKRPATSRTLVAMQLAATGADAYLTNHNLQNRCFYESDPLARPLVRNTTWVAASNAVGTGSLLVAEWELRRHHHERLAAILAAGDIGGHTYGAVSSRFQGRYH